MDKFSIMVKRCKKQIRVTLMIPADTQSAKKVRLQINQAHSRFPVLKKFGIYFQRIKLCIIDNRKIKEKEENGSISRYLQWN